MDILVGGARGVTRMTLGFVDHINGRVLNFAETLVQPLAKLAHLRNIVQIGVGQQLTQVALQ